MPPEFSKSSAAAIPVHVIEKDKLLNWMASQDDSTKNWIKANGFDASLGEVLPIPGSRGQIAAVLAGWGDARARGRGRFHMAGIARALPAGVYQIASGMAGDALSEAALAWLLSAYEFDRYKAKPAKKPQIQIPDGVDAPRLLALARGVFLTRDLINTPASDMGPAALQVAFQTLADNHNASVAVIKGKALLKKNLPLIHAVGRASDQAPRLLELRWGEDSNPGVTLVGKGVCFDTGGLNIKPGASMGLMKKDMGGAATAMGLAQMIMELRLPVRLRLLVPAVENSISAGAFRPGDILTSRKGLTVEVNNTDAEGRLVLADALALADEEAPDLLVSMATLTGAARVALGPDVPPFYTDRDDLAKDIAIAAAAQADPLWRMPFWDPYEPMLEPGIADLDNAPSGGFAGSISAALFLRRFIDKTTDFVHLDIYGWTPEAKPGRPKGGACQSARALLQVIERRLC
jgi:leucyl aminopeptidase